MAIRITVKGVGPDGEDDTMVHADEQGALTDLRFIIGVHSLYDYSTVVIDFDKEAVDDDAHSA